MALIHHTFGPHADARYIRSSLWLLVRPWKWRDQEAIESFRVALEATFDGKAYLFGSGRQALLALFQSRGYEPGSEIIIQGFTCIAVPNAVRAAGCVPIYADIDPETLNIDPREVEKHITEQTRAILCQHTFGIVAETKALKKITEKHKLDLIEDCAHILPDETGPNEIGKHSDYIMLSFGRDKAISGIAGGAIIALSKKRDSKLQERESHAAETSLLEVLRLLLYPTIYGICRPIYGIGIGKLLLWLISKARLLSPVLTHSERQGLQSPVLRKMPGACAALAHEELKKIKMINKHRRELTALYMAASEKNGWRTPQALQAHLPLQKFPILLSGADRMRTNLKRKNIRLEDGWTGAAVCPRSTNAHAAGYKQGMCPIAERIAAEILTLPTHPTMRTRGAERLIAVLRVKKG